MLDKITAFIDSLLINTLLITIFVLSTELAFKPEVPPEEEVIQVVALDEGQVRDTLKLIKQEEKRQLEAQQAKQRELDKIAYEPQQHKEEPRKPKEKIEPPKPKEPVEDKQKRTKERKKLEQKQLEEANRKAQEKAEKERQRLEVAKRKARQLEEERLAKAVEKKQRKKIEEKQKERERVAKQEKVEEKKRQAREEQKRKTAEKRKVPEQSAKQEEKREAEKQRKAEAAKRKAAAEAAEKRKAAAAAEKRKKEADNAAQQKRAQDNKDRIGQVTAKIKSRIMSRWRQPAGTNLSCVVFVSILPSGALIPRLSKSSGNGAFDQSALAAVRSASPFPIPKELLGFFRGEGVSVTFRSH